MNCAGSNPIKLYEYKQYPYNIKMRQKLNESGKFMEKMNYYKNSRDRKSAIRRRREPP